MFHVNLQIYPFIKIFFSTGQAVYTLHTSTIPRLTDLLFLYLYLQQTIIQTVSLTLSKAVQQLSINHPHIYQQTIPDHNP